MPARPDRACLCARGRCSAGTDNLTHASADAVLQLAGLAAAVSSVPKAFEAVLGNFFFDSHISGRRARQERWRGC